LSQNDLTDGWLFIISGGAFVVLFLAFSIFKAFILRGVKKYQKKSYGCECGCMFRIDEGLSEEEADYLIGRLDGGQLPPRFLKYTCEGCSASKHRLKGPSQAEVIWREPEADRSL